MAGNGVRLHGIKAVGGDKDRPTGGKSRQRFADQPLCGGMLGIPRADVVAAGIAKNVILRVFLRDMPGLATDNDDKLRFIVIFFQPRRKDNICLLYTSDAADD